MSLPNSHRPYSILRNVVRQHVMSRRDELINGLARAFPQRPLSGDAAPHDCPECSGIRDTLAGVTWAEVPPEFVRENPDILPLLAPDAYVTFLPAWLREAVLDPEGPVTSMLRVNLEAGRTERFSPDQAKMIVEVAKWISANDSYGSDDEVNVESLAKILAIWGRHSV